MVASSVARAPPDSQITVTGRERPGDPVTATLTSPLRLSPGPARVIPNGPVVSTPPPTTRTATAAPASPASVASTETRTTCSGRPALPVNRSVDSTPVIRMALSFHGTPSPRGLPVPAGRFGTRDGPV